MATTAAPTPAEAQAAYDELVATPETHPQYAARALRAITLYAALFAASFPELLAVTEPRAKRTPRSTKTSTTTNEQDNA